MANFEEPKRQGSIRPDPVLYSDVKSTKDAKQIRAILGDPLYDALFEEGANSLLKAPALVVTAGQVIFWPVLIFNTQERAIFRLYDTLDAPADGPEPLHWQKKLAEDGGTLFRKASQVCGWK